MMDQKSVKVLTEWEEFQELMRRRGAIDIWDAIALLRKGVLAHYKTRDEIYQWIDQEIERYDIEFRKLNRLLPMVVRIINNSKNIEQWRTNNELWCLKEFVGGTFVFSRVVNGREEIVKIDDKTFNKIKKDELGGFDIKTVKRIVKEHVFINGNTIIPESLISFIKSYKLPKGVTGKKTDENKVDKNQVLELIKSKARVKDIADKFNVTPGYISQLKKRFEKEGLLDVGNSGQKI